MLLDLDSLLRSHHDLSTLEEPFTMSPNLKALMQIQIAPIYLYMPPRVYLLLFDEQPANYLMNLPKR